MNLQFYANTHCLFTKQTKIIITIIDLLVIFLIQLGNAHLHIYM